MADSSETTITSSTSAGTMPASGRLLRSSSIAASRTSSRGTKISVRRSKPHPSKLDVAASKVAVVAVLDVNKRS